MERDGAIERMPSIQELFLIRHGETEWSRSGQHTSRTDLTLTEEGKRRGLVLKTYLARKKFARVLTSPMQRARLTCDLAGFGEQAEVDQNLMEWDYGEYEGLTTDQIRKLKPDWTIWNSTPPGGESAARVGERADLVIARAAQAGADVALFGHGHMLRVIAARWLSLQPSDGRLFALDTGTISILDYERETRVIRQWNFAP
jgi:broad specificity phosphatase PhoE